MTTIDILGEGKYIVVMGLSGEFSILQDTKMNRLWYRTIYYEGTEAECEEYVNNNEV